MKKKNKEKSGKDNSRLNVIIPLTLREAYKKHCIDKRISMMKDINNYIQNEVSKVNSQEKPA